MVKKRRIKKKAKILILSIVIIIIALIIGVKQYKTYLYHQTYEYMFELFQ